MIRRGHTVQTIIPTIRLKDTVEAKTRTKAVIISLKDAIISPKAKDNTIKDSSIIMKSSSKLESLTSIHQLARQLCGRRLTGIRMSHQFAARMLLDLIIPNFSDNVPSTMFPKNTYYIFYQTKNKIKSRV